MKKKGKFIFKFEENPTKNISETEEKQSFLFEKLEEGNRNSFINKNPFDKESNSEKKIEKDLNLQKDKGCSRGKDGRFIKKENEKGELFNINTNPFLSIYKR